MKSTDIPTKFQIPFGKSAAAGTIRAIPVADQTGTSPGAASLTTGFPPATGQPLASGGIPPSMQDFNGLLNQDTAWAWWQGAGGTVPFDQTFANAVGGYPAGALLASTTTGVLWLNLVDNNTTNPDSPTGANWTALATIAALNARKIVSSVPKPYSTPGIYTLPIAANTTFQMTVRGGGGGGGGCFGPGAGASGGGGGGYALKVVTATVDTTIQIAVGAGGSGGAASNPPTGGTVGGTSYVSVISGSVTDGPNTFTAGQIICAATGGGGGAGGNGGLQSTFFGASGVPSGGDLNKAGDTGGYPYSVGSGIIGGSGGASPYSGSSPGPNLSAQGITSFAAGVGGNGDSGAKGGGAGSPGEIIIYK